MPEPRTLPHDAYITAVCAALTAAGLGLSDHGADTWTDDGETLTAVITLDPDGTTDLDSGDIPTGTRWPNGLILRWEWHLGIEQGEPERGPLWEFAELKADGSNEYPTALPVYGYASPAAVVEAARRVIAHEIGAGHFYNGGQWTGWTGGLIGDSWENASELDAACEAWGNAEGGEAS